MVSTSVVDSVIGAATFSVVSGNVVASFVLESNTVLSIPVVISGNRFHCCGFYWCGNNRCSGFW